MDCRETEELLPAYALNALSPQEEASVEAHLETCPWCPGLLREHIQVTAALALAAEHMPPPRQLKANTMRRAESLFRRSGRSSRPLFALKPLALGIASMGILLLGAVVAVGIHISNEIDELQRENTSLSAQMSGLAEEDKKIMEMSEEQRTVSYTMASPDKQVLALQGSTTLPKAEGILLITSQGSTGILMAKGLDSASQTIAYQVWLTKDGRPVTLGHLSVDHNGWGFISLWPDQPLDLFERVWVTEEPAQETARTEPSGETVLWANIASR